MAKRKVTQIRDVRARRDVIMGDQIHTTADVTRLEALLEEIIRLLRQPQTRVEVGGDVEGAILVIGNENRVSLSRDEGGWFVKLHADADPRRREEIYLTRYILD